MKEIAKLQLITQPVEGKSIGDVVRAACEGGVKWVQVRIKEATPDQWKTEALEAKKVCQEFGATLIINDNPSLAKEIGADGIHIGKQDMPPAEARALLGPDFIIGGTANTLDDVLQLASSGAVDYIGLGPYRFTETKKNLSPILGLEGYQRIIKELEARNLTIPVIAIGGILPEDVEKILASGMYGIAVSSGINLSKTPEKEVISYLKGIYQPTI